MKELRPATEQDRLKPAAMVALAAIVLIFPRSILPQRETMSADKPISRETLEGLLADSPFQQLLGLRLDAIDPAAQSITIRSIYGPNVERAAGTGQYHGGVIASLIDIAGDFALIAVLGYGVPTINFRVDYLRPAAHSDLLAQARVRRAGRTIGVVDIDVTNADGRLIALGRGCYGTQPG